MRQTGIDGDGKLVEVNGHLYKVRTKTFKMVDEPTVEETYASVQQRAISFGISASLGGFVLQCSWEGGRSESSFAYSSKEAFFSSRGEANIQI